MSVIFNFSTRSLVTISSIGTKIVLPSLLIAIQQNDHHGKAGDLSLGFD